MPSDRPTFSPLPLSPLPQWLQRLIHPLSRRPVWQVTTVAIFATLGLTITAIELFVLSRWALVESVQGLIWLLAGVVTLIAFLTVPIGLGWLARSSVTLARTNGIHPRWSWLLVAIALGCGGAIGLISRSLLH